MGGVHPICLSRKTKRPSDVWEKSFQTKKFPKQKTPFGILVPGFYFASKRCLGRTKSTHIHPFLESSWSHPNLFLQKPTTIVYTNLYRRGRSRCQIHAFGRVSSTKPLFLPYKRKKNTGSNGKIYAQIGTKKQRDSASLSIRSENR